MNSSNSRVIRSIVGHRGPFGGVATNPFDWLRFLARRSEQSSSPQAGVHLTLPTEWDSVEEQAKQVFKKMEAHRFSPPNRAATGHYSIQIQKALIVLCSENVTLQKQPGKQEAELNKVKAALGSQHEEWDQPRRKVRDLQSKLPAVLSQSSMGNQTGSPTHCKTPGNSSLSSERASSCEDMAIAKIAERIRLKKTENGEWQILRPEITSLGVYSSKVAEHLVYPLQEESRSQEIFQELYSSGSQISASHQIREFEVETERLSARIEHWKSQNDLISLTLEDSKCQCDRLSVLIGKYESNNTALQIALGYTDLTLEAYEVLTALFETETGLLLANYRAAGLGSVFKHIPEALSNENDDEAAILKRAIDNRRKVESIARHLLVRLDHNYDLMCGAMRCTISPWDDLSSHNCTTSITSSISSSWNTDFSRSEEQRLRDHISQLKNERWSVQTTILELESVHVDPIVRRPSSALESQNLDFENAVLMQELTAMKEEKTDLKAQVYLLEHERASFELRLSSQDAQEKAYLAHIEHLKSEVKELQEASEKLSEGYMRHLQNGESSELADDLGHELAEALKREKKLKLRLQELVSTVEKVNKNSELRHQQSAEFVNDLKRANSILVAAFEKSKRKYLTKIKKMEHQLLLMVDRHSSQMRLLKQRIIMLEDADKVCQILQREIKETAV